LPADIHKSRAKRLWKERLSVYLRCLNDLSTEGARTVSSQGLADRFDLNSDQISRDLASFREIRGDGAAYDIDGLRNSVTKALRLDRDPGPMRDECGQSEHCFEGDRRKTASPATAQSLVR
jgi:NADH/NAD ratio-sensing transcriptional regulator Rex